MGKGNYMKATLYTNNEVGRRHSKVFVNELILCNLGVILYLFGGSSLKTTQDGIHTANNGLDEHTITERCPGQGK